MKTNFITSFIISIIFKLLEKGLKEKEALYKDCRTFHKRIHLSKQEFNFLKDKNVKLDGDYLVLPNKRGWKQLFQILIECDKALGRDNSIKPHFDANTLYHKVHYEHRKKMDIDERKRLKKQKKKDVEYEKRKD